MDDKIAYHLTSLISEIKTLITQEISSAVNSGLIEAHSEINRTSDEILTINEVASKFKISKSHINKLREIHADFPVIQIGGSIRFDKNELEEFIKKKSLLNKKH